MHHHQKPSNFDDRLIGLFMCDHCLTAERFLNFLEDHLPELLEDVLLWDKTRMWFQHDTALVLFARCVKQFLKQWYP
jgi:hypothetical protein